MDTLLSGDVRPRHIDLDELASRLKQRRSPAEGLAQLVNLVRHRLRTDVCSVYFIEPDRAHLVLAATKGLLAEAVGRVRMPMREGLVGLVAEQLQPVVVEEAERHPRFKYFPETGEEVYRSFAGVPVLDMGVLLGVLVVQSAAARLFSADEVRDLVELSGQIAPLVGELRTQAHFSSQTYDRTRALARNLWWSWDNDATEIFRELAPSRWRELEHNPIMLVDEMSLDHLEQRAQEMVLHGRINHAYRRMQEYRVDRNTWGGTHAGVLWARPVAYF